MAVNGDSSYLPPLEQCLNRDKKLLSWKEAYTLLTETRPSRLSLHLQHFLEDETTKAILRQWLSPFQTRDDAARQQAKVAFETRTSPAAFSHVDAEETKDAAIWLSEEVKLDLLSSLRLAVLERLERPTSRLLEDFTEEETNALRNATDGGDLAASVLRFDATITANSLPAAFEAKPSRNARLLRTYLSERLHVVRVGEYLRRHLINRPDTSPSLNSTPWLVAVTEHISESDGGQQNWSGLCKLVTTSIQERLPGIISERNETNAEDGFGEAQAWTLLAEVAVILQHTLDIAISIDAIADASAVRTWFDFMSSQCFFKDLVPNTQAQQSTVALLQSLTAVISVEILQPSIIDDISSHSREAAIEQQGRMFASSYIHDLGCIGDLQQIFLDTTLWGSSPATPALLTWTALLLTLRDAASVSGDQQEILAIEDDDDAFPYQRSSSIAPAESPFERTVEVVQKSVPDQDVFQYLATSAIDVCQAYSVISILSTAVKSSLASNADNTTQLHARSILLQLLERSSFLTGYSSELVTAALTVVEGTNRSWEHAEADSVLLEGFTASQSFLRDLAREARLRYPLELLPLLAFSKVQLRLPLQDKTEVPSVLEELKHLSHFTEIMPDNFYGYDLTSPDHDFNRIQLNEPLAIFRLKRNAITYKSASTALIRSDNSSELEIAQDTEGRVIADTRPHIATWQHSHSALQYLTNKLATLTSACEYVEASSSKQMSLADASETINFFTNSVNAIFDLPNNEKADTKEHLASKVIFSMRDGFNPGRDLVSIIFDIFEQQLQSHGQNSSEDGSVEVLVSCAQFVTATTRVFPGRIWSFLAKSTLLGLGEGGGNLVAVVESTEMVSGRYDFLIACLGLYEELLGDAVRSSVAKKSSRSTTRFESGIDKLSAPDRTITVVLSALTRTASGLLTNSLDWRFASQDDKVAFQSRALNCLGEVLNFTYAFDDNKDTSKKLTAVLAGSASYVTSYFTSNESASVALQPLLQILFEAASVKYETLTASQKQSWHEQAHSALQFLTLLVQTRTYLDLSARSFIVTLFRITPLLSRLYAVHDGCRRAILVLLENIVKTASSLSKEPPSLLGHLGADAARSFLSLLTEDTINSTDLGLQVALFHLYSTVVSCKQQWFAIFILTGGTAKDTIKSGDNSHANSTKSILKAALKRLSKLSDLDHTVSLALLKFVKLAQNYWPRVIRDVRSNPDFIDGLLEYLGSLKRNERERDSERLIKASQETRIASTIAEILAINVHAARQLGDFSLAEKLIPKLSFFKEFGVAAPRYNNSLHANLKKNLEAKYPGCKLENFKRSSFRPSELGSSFFYDADFASTVLGFDPNWSKPRSLQTEFPLANIDLSLVEAQIELLYSWKLLAMELSNLVDRIPRAQELLLSTARKCLDANSGTENPPALVERLLQVRVDFAFVLLQKLLQSSINLEQLGDLFDQVWTTITSSNVDFDLGFASPDANYYRSLLKLLFLALKPHVEGARPLTESKIKSARPLIAVQLLEVFAKVIALGFRTLATQQHEAPSATAPSDLILITALLQCALRVHGISTLYSQIVSIFTAANITRYATSLFSWSDQLAISLESSSPDPIFGELSILFLLELSTVPLMAEAMAVEGVLAGLGTAQLCQSFERGNGRGPFDEPPRLFSIWFKGILPLVLNLLDAVGTPVAAEIASFLNQYSPQMARNARALESRVPLRGSVRGRNGEPFAAAITLSLASETHTLALLSFALRRARNLGSAAGVNPDDIEELEWDEEAVKEDLRAWLDGTRTLADRIIAMDEREEKMLRTPAVKDKRCENLLEEKILREFAGALTCLNGGDLGET